MQQLHMLADQLAITIQERTQVLVSFLVPNVPNTIYSLARPSCFPDRILPPRFSKCLDYCHRLLGSNRIQVLTVRAAQVSDRIRAVSRTATSQVLKKLMKQTVSNRVMQALVIHFQSGSRSVVTKSIVSFLINQAVKSRYSKRKSHPTMLISEIDL